MASPSGNQPVFACAYGPSKSGKTTDSLYAFGRGLFLAEPAALKPHRWIGVPSPRSQNPLTLMQLNSMLAKAEPPKDAGKVTSEGVYFPSIVVDDLSLLIEATLGELEKKLTGFKLWGALRDEILEFRDGSRRKGLHLWCNAHESGGGEKNGRTLRIGPKMPGSLPEDFPAQCDLVVRCAPGTSERLGWNWVFRVNVPGSITGDRDGVAYDGCPMNSAELLRANGFAVPRPDGLEWLSGPVAKLADGFHAKLVGAENLDPVKELALKALPALETKYRQGMEIRRWNSMRDWILRDAYDRAEIRLALERGVGPFSHLDSL